MDCAIQYVVLYHFDAKDHVSAIPNILKDHYTLQLI